MYQGPLQEAGIPQPAILIIVHQESSDPGRIGEQLRARGYHLDIRRPCLGQELPATLEHHAGCVIFGGPMSANDGRLPFIHQELDFIPKRLKSGTPSLDLCLVAHLLRFPDGQNAFLHQLVDQRIR